MKIITIFLHRRITMKITMINNYNWITIYFYIFIFMLNFFLLFVDCILQTIGNDIKSSSYIMYFIKILYHETKVFIINCDEDVMKVFVEVLYQNCCDEDSLKFCRLIVVMKFYIKIVVMKYSMKIYHSISRWNIRWSSVTQYHDEIFDEDVMKMCWSIRWSSISKLLWWRFVEVLSLNWCDEDSLKFCHSISRWNIRWRCDEDVLKFCRLIVVMKFYIKIVVMKIRWSSVT